MKPIHTLIAAVFLAIFSTPATADFTHLAVDHRDLIRLKFSFGSGSAACGGYSTGAFKLAQPGGPTSPNEYQVPAGKELIVTDIVWRALPAPASNWVVTRALSATLNIYTEAGSFNGILVSLPLVNNLPSADDSYKGGEAHFVGGLRVASRRYLCPGAAQIYASGFFTATVREMEIIGYEIDKSK